MTTEWFKSELLILISFFVFIIVSARNMTNERSRLVQIISTNIHKMTQNGLRFCVSILGLDFLLELIIQHLLLR